MDLFNNAVGIAHESDSLFPIFITNTSLSAQIYQKLLNGELRYLGPLLPPAVSRASNAIPGGDPNFATTHGINSLTQLKPTSK